MLLIDYEKSESGIYLDVKVMGLFFVENYLSCLFSSSRDFWPMSGGNGQRDPFHKNWLCFNSHILASMEHLDENF